MADHRSSRCRGAGIRFFLLSICVLSGGLSCPSETVPGPQTHASQGAESLVLFFSGSTLGKLKPCGCSGGQLGGLEKRLAVFNEAPASRRLIVDTGTLVESDREQDLIKFRVLFEAFRLLGYDAVSLTPQDVRIADSLGLLAGEEHAFDVVCSAWGPANADGPRSFSRTFQLGRETLAVTVVACDARTDAPEQVAALSRSPAPGRRLNVLILDGIDPESLSRWTQAAGADCIVCPSTSDEPLLLSEPGHLPLVFTVGRYGRHLCRVRVSLPPSDGPLALDFTDVPVSEDLPDAPALVQLYRQYQRLVSESNLLEKYPRVPLPDGLKYAGSKSCEPCHLYEYALWSEKAHADAFATLVEVGSDRDPECVVCHVVGMERESGFVTAEKTPGLKDVGCEVCHGPGSGHNASQGLTATTGPKAACLDCHTPEHSTGYAGHEAEFREKIVHWWEP